MMNLVLRDIDEIRDSSQSKMNYTEEQMGSVRNQASTRQELINSLDGESEAIGRYLATVGDVDLVFRSKCLIISLHGHLHVNFQFRRPKGF